MRTRGTGWWWAIFIVCIAVLLGGPAAAGNPDQRWRTIETEHFYVHYSVGEEDAAERVATTAERAYDSLSVAWGHDVFLKTHITLADTQDTANGRATAVPFPQVTAYATAPETLSVLEGYDDWIDILITHELVHIFHLDTVHGIPRIINAVFGFGVLGKLTSPNILQPRWVVEGVATYEESDKSGHGRRRSAQFDALIRMAVLEGRFQTIDQTSSGARIYPHGTSVYLYGVHLMYYIAARYGADKLRELSHKYGGQLVPYGINRVVQDVLGVDFFTLWEEFKQDTTRRFLAQARRIRGRGLRQGRRLTYNGESTRYPFWAPEDDYIYFFKADGHLRDGIKRISSRGGRIREGVGIGRQGQDVDLEFIVKVEGSTPGSFVGASQDIVFDLTGTYDNRYRWSDLYRHNGGDPRTYEQLTFGKRASEPHVSPDGRTVVFRRNDIAQSRLGFLDLAEGTVTEVAPAGRISQVYTPRWSPDGTKVAYSGFREGGYRDLYVYDVGSGETTQLTADRHMDVTPSWTPDGRYIVFSSDRDQVFNIHAYDMQTRRVHQVSNVLGAAFEPMVSHDGTRIAYTGYASNGYDLWVMKFDPDTWLPVMPSVSELPQVDDNKPPIVAGDRRPPTVGSRRYQAWRTLFPRAVFPTALDFSSSAFGRSLGLDLAVVDVLGWHAAAGNINYLVDQRLATGRVAYSYARLFPNFGFAVSRGYSEPGGFTRYVYDRDEDENGTYTQAGYRERSTAARASMSLPIIRHPRHSASLSTSYRWTRWTNLDAGSVPIDPTAPSAELPEVGDAAQIDLSADYSNTGDGSRRFTYSTERGRSVGFNVSVLDRRLGGDFGDVQASASYREVVPMPWRGHQSLSLSLRGGASAGGLGRRGAFCVGDYNSGGDVVRSILNRARTSARGCSLMRGYVPRAFAGRYFTVASAQYRIPLYDLDRGLGSVPFFFQRVGMIPFADWGNAWTNPITARDMRWGAGAALVMSFRVGYVESVHLFFQYAHGFDDEQGIDSLRAVVATSF